MDWLTDISDCNGFKVHSPATGVVLPLSEHPDLLYNANVLAQALCIKLQEGTLTAPFTAKFSYCMQSGRRLCFRHRCGLTVQLDLPDIAGQPNPAIRHLVDSGEQVQIGQPVVKLDLQLMQATEQAIVVLMVLPQPAISAIYCKEGYLTATENILVIQFKKDEI